MRYFDDKEPEPIESESLRPDRRARLAGSEIVVCRSREEFMRAVGGRELKLPDISANEAHRGMLKAWEEKYGAVR